MVQVEGIVSTGTSIPVYWCWYISILVLVHRFTGTCTSVYLVYQYTGASIPGYWCWYISILVLVYQYTGDGISVYWCWYISMLVVVHQYTATGISISMRLRCGRAVG